MPAATDAVWLDVLPNMSKFGPALSKGATAQGAAAGKVAGMSFGKAAIAGVALIAGGAALATKALYNIGATFDQVQDTIRVGTGATGDALKGLTDSAKAVGTQVPASFDDVGTAVADLNTRLGLTGGALEERSAQFLELSRITGTDLAGNIAGITRVFGDWGIETEDQAGAMDKIFRASQSTGIGVDALSEKVVQFGAPLRQLGFGFEESLALFGKWEKEGVNLEAVMSGMRMGLGKLSKAGEDPTKALARLQEEIKGASSAGEANAIAIEAFGQRAGPDMAAAIREGRFELGDLIDTIENGGETIMAAGGDTMDFSEQWQMFKNKVMVGLAPLAERVFGAITAGMTWINEHGVPAVRDLVAQGRWLGSLFRDAASGMDMWMGEATPLERVVVAVGAAFGKAFGFVRDTAIPALRDFGGWVRRNQAWLIPLAAGIVAIVVAVKAWNLALKAYRAIQAAVVAVTAAWNAVLALNPIGVVVLLIVGLVAALVTAYRTSDTFRATVDRAWQGVQSAVRSVVGWFTGTAWPAIKGVWDAISAGATALWRNYLKPAWEGIRLAIQVAIEAIRLYWNNILKPVWNAVAAAARWMWNNVLSPVFGWIGRRWNEVLAGMRIVWDTVLKPTFDAVGRAVGVVRDAVGKAVTAIGRAWDGLKKAFASPVNWVIDNVINKFLGWVNDIAGKMGLSIKLDLLGNVATGETDVRGRPMNKGGAVPGHGPDRDSVHAYLTPGEHVWTRSEVRAAGGHGAVEAMRQAAKRGQIEGDCAYDRHPGSGALAKGALGGQWMDMLREGRQLSITASNESKSRWGAAAGVGSWSGTGMRVGLGSGAHGTAPGARGYMLTANEPIDAYGYAYLSKVGDAVRGYARLNERYLAVLSSSARQSVASHEVGHLLGLAHTSGRSVMNTDRDRNSVTGPTSADMATLHGLFPALDAPDTDGSPNLLGGILGALLERLTGPARNLMNSAGERFGFPGSMVAGVGNKLLDGVIGWVRSKQEAAQNSPGGAVPGGPGIGGGIGVAAMMNILRGVFPGLPLISGYRPGAVTATGNPSWHGKSRAVDIPPRMDVFEWLRSNYGSSSLELIFSPAGGRQIYRGRNHMFGEPTRGDHWDHIHWAYDQGGMLPPGVSLAANWTGKPEAVLTDGQWRTIADLASRGPQTVDRSVHLDVAYQGREMTPARLVHTLNKAQLLGETVDA